MSGALSTAGLRMVEHLKNTTDNTSLFFRVCFPKVLISLINLSFCGLPVNGLLKRRKSETLHAQNFHTEESPFRM